MKALITAVFGFIACAVCAGEPVAGGIRFSRAVNVDGVDYPAGTTIYAESYPTQFVVKPVVSAGTYIFYGTFDANHGGQKVYPDYTGTTFMLMPPPTVGDVVEVTFSSYANYVWADANTDVPDAEQDGTEEKPYRVLQKAVDGMLAKNKSYNMVLVKPGVYDEGGTPRIDGSGENGRLACRVCVGTAKQSFIIRAVGGPLVTSIVGAKDTTSGEPAPYEGWGTNGVRCVQLRDGGCLQGFTLINGAGARETAASANHKQGGAVAGSGPSSAIVLDCVVSNACANAGGAICSASMVRCRVVDCVARMSLVYNANVVSCEFYGNRLVAQPAGQKYFEQCKLYNCTFASGDTSRSIGIDAAYNSIIADVGSINAAAGANNWAWNVTTRPDASVFTVDNPLFRKPLTGDLRLTRISPCIGSIEAPTGANYGTNYWKFATSDLNGGLLHVAADGKLTAGALQTEFPDEIALYVDATNGSDANDGLQLGSALKTLAAAMTNDNCFVGVTVYVAPGVYDSGTMASDDGDVRNRVSIPEGVSLVSLGGATNTVIMGAAATETTAPVRCVHMHRNTSLVGFTLTGGHTDSSVGGGGVYAPSAYGGKTRVSDCIITNNVSGYRGGGANACALYRCYLGNNEVTDSSRLGSASNAGMLCNCIVDSQKTSSTRCYITTIRNCTFLPTKTANAQEAIGFSSSADTNNCYNSIFLCKTRPEANYVSCIIATNATDVGTRTFNPAVLGETVRLVTVAEAKVKPNGGLWRSSPAVDAGSNALYDMSWGDVDIRGARRIVNGTIDIGACEFDPSLLKGLMFIFR
ncbi:MAG: hypothetical protein IJQ65_04585 [Kiritimatiellae bacterium]|nr:hypothetical protein [Kiritimatiellia bacterium]